MTKINRNTADYANKSTADITDKTIETDEPHPIENAALPDEETNGDVEQIEVFNDAASTIDENQID